MYIVFGTGHLNHALEPTLEIETIQINALAFAAVASHAMGHFTRQGHGTIVGISSVAAARGSAHVPAYNASKAFVASYLKELRLRTLKQSTPIQITEIRPGSVDTAMMKTEKPFWVVSPDIAAKRILSVVEKGKPVAYVPRRWAFIAVLLRCLPEFIYKKL
ncbi:hypothetical protein VDG1235_3944 [Verrucomicrobiia bacterium DG1235]|nr:hypothetical protein VDG1235_3944 [Verrucomicrobiae bacterium DG1235]